MAQLLNGYFFESDEIDEAYKNGKLVWKKEAPVPTGTPLSDLAIGETVKLNENGEVAEWIIVHKGSPNSSYENADGTWLLRKEVHSMIEPTLDDCRGWFDNQFDEACNDFFDEKLFAYDNVILEATIPSNYNPNQNPYYSPTDDRKCFLLSATEVGIKTNSLEFYSYFPESRVNVKNIAPDSKLDYFNLYDASDAKRVGKHKGSNVYWATRTNARESDGVTLAGIVSIAPSGGRFVSKNFDAKGVRPAVVVSKEAMVDKDNILIP